MKDQNRGISRRNSSNQRMIVESGSLSWKCLKWSQNCPVARRGERERERGLTVAKDDVVASQRKNEELRDHRSIFPACSVLPLLCREFRLRFQSSFSSIASVVMLLFRPKNKKTIAVISVQPLCISTFTLSSSINYKILKWHQTFPLLSLVPYTLVSLQKITHLQIMYISWCMFDHSSNISMLICHKLWWFARYMKIVIHPCIILKTDNTSLTDMPYCKLWIYHVDLTKLVGTPIEKRFPLVKYWHEIVLLHYPIPRTNAFSFMW